MFRALILPAASLDIADSAQWYNGQQKGLGKRFTTQLRNIIKRARANPRAFPVRYDNTRTALLEDFPFMIHYQVDEDSRQIIIAAVLHTSRNPDIWAQRKNAE
jgi:plasmid stabilization system protein ParE